MFTGVGLIPPASAANYVPWAIIGFLSQWKMYLDQLPAGPEGGKAFRGKPLDPTTLEKVRSVDGHRFIAIDVLCSP